MTWWMILHRDIFLLSAEGRMNHKNKAHPRTELKINYLTVRYLGCRKADWRSSASSARGNFGGRWPRWPFKTLHYFTIIEAVHTVSWQIWQNHKFPCPSRPPYPVFSVGRLAQAHSIRRSSGVAHDAAWCMGMDRNLVPLR